MKDLVSVIVPVYKVEEYLDRCVTSIVSQTYKNLQIILVDDGSPDNCPFLCEKWAEKDSRIQVIHKENGGLSDARNAGIRAASGQYIALVDSDDYIHPQFIEILYYYAKVKKVDVIGCVYENVKKTTLQNEFKKICIEKVGLKQGKTVDEYFMGKGVVAWNKLYRRTVFENIKFPVGRIHEDNGIAWKLRYHVPNMFLIMEPLYYYCENPSGIMRNSCNMKHMDLVEVLYEQYLEFKNMGECTFASKILDNCLKSYIVLYCKFSKEKGFNKESKKTFKSHYRQKVKMSLNDQYFKKHLKLKHIIYSRVPVVGAVIYKLQRKLCSEP